MEKKSLKIPKKSLHFSGTTQGEKSLKIPKKESHFSGTTEKCDYFLGIFKLFFPLCRSREM
jgi:hypothetical protein